jgi:hypothetical protein
MREPDEVTQAKSRALASALRRASSRGVVVFVAPIEGLIDNTLYRSVGGGRGLPRLANLDELRALLSKGGR